MKKPKPNKSIALCSLLIALFSLSCQTAPRTPDAEPGDAEFISLPLEPGAFAYIIADVKNSGSLLNNLLFVNMNGKQLQQMLDMTRSAAAAVYSPPGAAVMRYQLAAWGSYPSSRARMAMGFSKDWKKQRSNIAGTAFWYSVKDGLSIALDKTQARVSSFTGTVPADPFSVTPASVQEASVQGTSVPGTLLPEGFDEFSRRAVLSCWLNDPGPLINLKLQEMGFPIELPAERIFICLFPAGNFPEGKLPAGKISTGENQYEARLRLEFSSANQARGLAAIFSLARAFLPPTGDYSDSSGAGVLQAILFTNPPEQNDRNLDIKSNALSDREIALLFNMFLL